MTIMTSAFSLCYSKKVKLVKFSLMDIEVLRETESPVIKGFWAEGHQNIKEFIKRAEVEFDIEDQPIDPLKVVHGWARETDDEELLEDYVYYILFSKRPQENTQKATYFFY